MPFTSHVFLLLGGFVALYVLSKIYGALYRDFTSTIRNIPGISTTRIITGSTGDMLLKDQATVHGRYLRELGTTFKFKGFFWDNWLCTADVKAISHVIRQDTRTWEKPLHLSYELSKLLGPGILLVNSEEHRKQRKILNPAFSPAQIRRVTETFLDKGTKLRDIWAAQIQQADGEKQQIDVLFGLGRASLDAIGEAGFGYKFDSLAEKHNSTNRELFDAFNILFKVTGRPEPIRQLSNSIPFMRLFTGERDKERTAAREIMDYIGKQLLSERILDHARSGKNSDGNNDIISLLVHANESGEGQRLPDDQVVAQIPTFIVAGHETTATTTAWALFSIAQNQVIQDRLRAELLAVTTDGPGMDVLNSLPYLDAVVRETLRVHPPIPSTLRVATEDDVLPLHAPVVDKSGKIHHELKVSKGQMVLISFTSVNQLEEIWGKDAHEFNPDRWFSLPEAAMSVPGVWGNTLSFFGGPRACIGYRFALAEMKAILFTLLRAFEFKLAVPATEITKESEIVTRPVLRTDPEQSNQMPLLVRSVA